MDRGRNPVWHVAILWRSVEKSCKSKASTIAQQNQPSAASSSNSNGNEGTKLNSTKNDVLKKISVLSTHISSNHFISTLSLVIARDFEKESK